MSRTKAFGERGDWTLLFDIQKQDSRLLFDRSSDISTINCECFIDLNIISQYHISWKCIFNSKFFFLFFRRKIVQHFVKTTTTTTELLNYIISFLFYAGIPCMTFSLSKTELNPQWRRFYDGVTMNSKFINYREIKNKKKRETNCSNNHSHDNGSSSNKKLVNVVAMNADVVRQGNNTTSCNIMIITAT